MAGPEYTVTATTTNENSLELLVPTDYLQINLKISMAPGEHPCEPSFSFLSSQHFP